MSTNKEIYVYTHNWFISMQIYQLLYTIYTIVYPSYSTCTAICCQKPYRVYHGIPLVYKKVRVSYIGIEKGKTPWAIVYHTVELLVMEQKNNMSLYVGTWHLPLGDLPSPSGDIECSLQLIVVRLGDEPVGPIDGSYDLIDDKEITMKSVLDCNIKVVPWIVTSTVKWPTIHSCCEWCCFNRWHRPFRKCDWIL